MIEPDIIFHLAAQTLVLRCYEQPVETFHTNVMGTANLLNAIRNIKRTRVAIVVTTDKVYKHVWRDIKRRYHWRPRTAPKE